MDTCAREKLYALEGRVVGRTVDWHREKVPRGGCWAVKGQAWFVEVTGVAVVVMEQRCRGRNSTVQGHGDRCCVVRG